MCLGFLFSDILKFENLNNIACSFVLVFCVELYMELFCYMYSVRIALFEK